MPAARWAGRLTLSLTLAIDGTRYAVLPVRGLDRAAAARGYALHKRGGRAAAVYHVRRSGGGGCACTCPDFVYRRAGVDPAGCKQIRALAAFGLLDARPPRPGRTGPGTA